MVSASHIRGVHNSLADALSRNDRLTFLSLYPQAHPTPTVIPPALVDLLISQAGLDVTALDHLVERYFHDALAPSTQRTYAPAQSRYINFCHLVLISPFPVTEPGLCRFAAQSAQERLSHSSIKGYFSAIRHLQIARGFPDPSISGMPRLEGVVRGIKASQARAELSKKNRLSITPSILDAIRSHWDQQGPTQDQVMLWAAASVCFFGFLRSGEITVQSDSSFDPKCHLTFGDVSVDDIVAPKLLRVHLKCSKTDPFRKGVDVFVGKMDNRLCPVTAMLAYLAGFLFRFTDGRLLTKARFVGELRQVLSATGHNPKDFAGHSFG